MSRTVSNVSGDVDRGVPSRTTSTNAADSQA